MFEISQNAIILEQFLEGNRAKKCRKASFRKKFNPRASPISIEQNHLRRILKRIIPAEMKNVEDNKFGVDYLFNGVKIDQKFSFGALGENTIKIRVKDRRLINASDFTMIINSKWGLEFFRTRALAEFVLQNWGLVQKGFIARKEEHSEYAVDLAELYRINNIIPIRASLDYEALSATLCKISPHALKCTATSAKQGAKIPQKIGDERVPQMPHPFPEHIFPKAK